MPLLDSLRRLDAYPKIDNEFSIRTVGGATLTITSSIIIVMLIYSEVIAYLTPTITDELFVDSTRDQKLKINLDFYIPRISCEYVSLDAQDATGEQHLHIEHSIYKRRLDLHGNPIEDAKKEDIQAIKHVKKEDASTMKPTVLCGSCYGAQANSTHCCNTCQDVIDAYREKKWNPNLENFEQCKIEAALGKTNLESRAFSEGCQIYGSMAVNRVGGSFHIAPGKSFSISHIHVHDVQPFSSGKFNTSHRINTLSFGDEFGYGQTRPLDSTEVMAEEGAMMFQYYIKIVPTEFVPLNGPTLHTNQFSVTKHQKSVSVMSGESGMPGIFVNYELSPLMVRFTEKRNSFSHFATNLCAIIGGIFTVVGIIDSFLFTSIHALKRKIELGKLS
ncbi:endoplasmic reticulum-Golgi intermediate compartment protein 3 [Toxorhynchites rutilus septentrionalis]|uniref:endoplasmic reticulum-Golgi intermediate compartment protein 3 n=1 Tax=Toxorhynchites rutilus septentrionalis TaxID=329112 RepID=UPI00247927B3|nr:endoplasmic reticulum-Golgi intermediate compartment protein 3 [Toxorhynchites rutilus septentrionalis]XP_055624121.1 endoplasmic reticulum-Golgi intermediate compartment protein 3 [Toxorhynchites rutilus septentrionalis]